jgi:hypothetical protein
MNGFLGFENANKYSLSFFGDQQSNKNEAFVATLRSREVFHGIYLNYSLYHYFS